ncbi:ligand-binding sensor domain-containing diguanylate cyclase [Lysobacter xanthus]
MPAATDRLSDAAPPRRPSVHVWRLRIAAVLVAMLAGIAPVGAQQPLKDDFAEVWTTRDGLPHSTVNAVRQTADGYLWLATWEGIARFNGRDFRLFRRGDIPGLLDDSVRALAIGPRGDLWAGSTRGGLVRFRNGRWTTLPPVDGLVSDLIELPDGRLWVATLAGLVRIEADGRRVSIGTAQGLSSGAVNAIAVDAGGQVWAGTSRGLARIVGDRAEAVAGLPPGTVLSLADTPDGLAVGTEHGPWRLRSGRFELMHPDLADDAVIRIWRDADGSYWFGTLGTGLARLDRGRIDRLGVDDGLPNNRVLAVQRDREGSLWLGTNAGLVRLRDAPMRAYTRAGSGLSDDFVRAVLATRDGRVWIGTSKGLNVHEAADAPMRVVGAGTPLATQSILSLAESPAGDVWIGTFHAGALRWSGGHVVETLDTRAGLPSNEVRAVLVGRDGRLWVGTKQGLYVRDARGGRVLDVASGLPSDYVQSLHESADGSVWIGTNGGPAIVRGDRVRSVDLRRAEDARYVFAVFEVPGITGTWLATDRGLVHVGPSGRVTQVSRAQGLPFEKVFAGVADRAGALWLTGNEGVVRTSVAELAAVLDGRRRALDTRLFGHGDGMMSSQANGGSGPSAALDRDGRVWVATALGVVRVDPARATHGRPALPPVALEVFEVDGRPQAPYAPHVLPAGSHRLAVEFASPSLVAAGRIRYRYRLDGFRPDWIELGDHREVQFTNLDPGHYTLHVQAYVPGERGTADMRVPFTAQPYWWQRRDVQMIAALLAGVLLAMLYRLRIRVLRSRERRLLSLVDERTQALQVQTRIAERLARTDPLTALANRRALDEGLAQAIAAAHGQTLALLLVDIDHFKQVNDTYSHAVGDLALRAVAEILQGQSRSCDVAARWGGEEFALLLVDCGPGQARAVAERVRAAIAMLDCEAYAPGMRLTASIGVALGDAEEGAERLTARADAALYRAKRTGRDRVCVDRMDPVAHAD